MAGTSRAQKAKLRAIAVELENIKTEVQNVESLGLTVPFYNLIKKDAELMSLISVDNIEAELNRRVHARGIKFTKVEQNKLLNKIQALDTISLDVEETEVAYSKYLSSMRIKGNTDLAEMVSDLSLREFITYDKLSGMLFEQYGHLQLASEEIVQIAAEYSKDNTFGKALSELLPKLADVEKEMEKEKKRTEMKGETYIGEQLDEDKLRKILARNLRKRRG